MRPGITSTIASAAMPLAAGRRAAGLGTVAERCGGCGCGRGCGGGW
ncbi:hypothetical protein ACFQYP_29955 [Nonomuraea antimicrobica]